MRDWRKGMLVSLLTVAVTVVSAADVETRIDAFVSAEMQREHVPGVAVGVFSKGEVLVARGYGFANVEYRVPVTAETVFQTASVGKQFTAVAVMLQVEAGRLGLDESIRAYFPDAPTSWQAITVRHLLTHTSGIPDYFDGLGPDQTQEFDLRRDYTEDELRQAFYRLPLEFEPGARWHYSNSGYALLGFLVRRVSGHFYGDVLAERVFRPLGMTTARVISESDIVPNRAAGYRLVDGELKNQEWYAPMVNTTADGSLYLSLLDYLAWDRGLRAGAILKPDSWAQVCAPVRLNSGRQYPYGFGWFIDQSKGQPWYRHSGSSQGFRTYISRALADDLTIVVLTNLIEAEPARFVDGIASIIDPGLAVIRPMLPVADNDPAIADRVRGLLVSLAGDGDPRQMLGDADQGVMKQADEYAASLRPAGHLQDLQLLDRRQLGDDQSSTFAARYMGGTLRVEVLLTPNGRIAELDISPN